MRELPDEPKLRRPRRSLLRRLGSDVGWLSMAGKTDTRVEIDALRQYGDEEGSQPGLLARVPGWLLIALLIAAFVFVLFFTDFA